MRLLVDTHALIWFLEGDRRWSAKAADAISGRGSLRFVSIISAWEMALKVSLGRLRLSIDFEQLFPGYLERMGLKLLPIVPAHLYHLRELPWHHRDPFDRLLIAQALAEQYTLITADTALTAYGVPVLW